MPSETIKSTPNPLFTWIGLAIALLGYPILSILINRFLKQGSTSYTVAGFIASWLLCANLLLVVLRGEKQPLASIGFATMHWKQILLAIGIGIVLSLTVPLLTMLTAQIIPATEKGSITAVTESASPWLLLGSVLTAGITEEILYRGFPIERLTTLTGSTWLAVVIAVIAFVLPHLTSWNLAHVVGVVLPLGIILSLFYLWKGSLIFNMIVHIMVNLPLVFIALMGEQ